MPVKNTEELRQEAICPELLQHYTRTITPETIANLTARLRDPHATAQECAQYDLTPHERKLVIFAAIREAARRTSPQRFRRRRSLSGKRPATAL